MERPRMTYDQLRQTTNGFVLHERNLSPRTILVPKSPDVATCEQVALIERQIVSEVSRALLERIATNIGAPRIERGTASDFVVIGRASEKQKASLHAVAFPNVADTQFVASFSSNVDGDHRLF